MSRRIDIRETVEARIPAQEITRIQESMKSSTGIPDKITTVVEAIHSGLTRNYTFYPADNLEKSVDSWTSPYKKPVIKNHDTMEEPLGRVQSGSFKQSNLAPDKQTIELTLQITDPETIKKVLDGRYQTLSIGGSTNSAICSICGKDLVKENYCGHMKGRTYEGKQAYWIIGEMNFDEISWVNVPADSNAQVVHKNTTAKQTESVSTVEGGMDDMPVDEHTADILEQIDNLVGNVTENEDTPETPEVPAVPVAEGDETPGTPEVPETPETPAQTEESTEPEGPTLEEQLAEANGRIATLEADNLTLTADKETLQESVTTLTDEVTTLKDELRIADEENKGLVKQSVTLATYTHKVLAESVATVQVALGKVEENAFEATMAELSKQTSRSLKEQLAALGKEKPMRIVQTIQHPQATGGSEDTTESMTQETPELTLADFADKISKAMNRQFN